MIADPCHACPLPDCDDGSRHCQLRQALREYYALWRKREPISAIVRERKRVAYRRLYGGDRKARRIRRDTSRMRPMTELSEVAYRALRNAASKPFPTQETDPGVVRALMDRGYVEVVDLPSPYRSHKRDKTVPHMRATDAGRAILEGI